MRNWQEWFVPPDETDDPADTEHRRREDAAEAAGSRNRGVDPMLTLKKRPQPRCVECKKFMGYSSGMYIMIADPWRLHISCFSKVVEERFEQGEVIDLTTGTVYQIELEADDS